MHSDGIGGFIFTTEGLSVFPAASGNAPLSFDTWHHVAVTYSGDGASNTSVVKFYINGVLTNTISSMGSSLVSNTSPLQIGFDPPGDPEYWNGKIDEVKIWSEALSASQIRVAMSAATPVARSLMGYWRFNEGSGLTARDRSSNGNDGTLNGGPSWSFPGAI